MTAPALALVSLLPTPSARLLLLLLSAMRILLLLLVLEPLRRPTLVALSTRRRTRASAERKKQIPSQLPVGRRLETPHELSSWQSRLVLPDGGKVCSSPPPP